MRKAVYGLWNDMPSGMLEVGLSTDNFLSGRPAGRWQKIDTKRVIGSAFFFIGSKPVRVSVQPDINSFVNSTNFFHGIPVHEKTVALPSKIPR